MITLLICVLALSRTFATTRISEGNDGLFYKQSTGPTPNEVLAKALTSPEVNALIGNQEILSVSKNDSLVLSYEINTTKCKIQMVINFLELPIAVDGVAAIEVKKNYYINVIPADKISNSQVTTCSKN